MKMTEFEKKANIHIELYNSIGKVPTKYMATADLVDYAFEADTIAEALEKLAKAITKSLTTYVEVKWDG